MQSATPLETVMQVFGAAQSALVAQIGRHAPLNGRSIDVHVAGARFRVVIEGAHREAALGESVEIADPR